MDFEHSKLAYTLDEAASVSGLGRTSLYVANGDGRLPFRKNGKRVLILADDLRRFLANLPTTTTNVAAWSRTVMPGKKNARLKKNRAASR